jgi:hypothetical protein
MMPSTVLLVPAVCRHRHVTRQPLLLAVFCSKSSCLACRICVVLGGPQCSCSPRNLPLCSSGCQHSTKG